MLLGKDAAAQRVARITYNADARQGSGSGSTTAQLQRLRRAVQLPESVQGK